MRRKALPLVHRDTTINVGNTMNSKIKVKIPLFTKPVIIFSRLFAVLPVFEDLSINYVGMWYTSIALTFCVLHLYFLPGIMMDIERKLTKVKRDISYNYFLKMLFPAVVFVTSCVSKVSCLFLLRPNIINYARLLSHIDANLHIKKQDIRRHAWFSIKVICVICLLTFPINLIRLRMFYDVSSGWAYVLLFANMYCQNISTCFHEVQFTTCTYSLFIRVRKVNRSLTILLQKQDLFSRVKYNKLLGMVSEFKHDEPINLILDDLNDTTKSQHVENSVNPETSLFNFGFAEVLNNITILRHVHKNIMDAAIFLQKAYGLTLLFSLCCVSLMLLFDVYFEFYGFIGGNAAKPSLATYLWCLQYSVRFVLVVETSQKMYDEVKNGIEKVI